VLTLIYCRDLLRPAHVPGGYFSLIAFCMRPFYEFPHSVVYLFDEAVEGAGLLLRKTA